MNNNLNETLKTWQPALATEPEIRRGVWLRIARKRQNRLYSAWESALLWLARPTPCAALIALAIMIGGIAGAGASAESQKSAYLTSVNPLAQDR